MFVASNLPHALTVEHKGRTIVINGANVGFDPENLHKNGLMPDTEFRAHGYGLTEVTGEDEAALKDWMEISRKGPGPVQNGSIIVTGNKADAKKEAKDADTAKTAAKGIDPDKDLPKGVETKKD